MIRHEFSEALVDWVEDMLADTNLAVRHGDITIEGKPHKGCPQGGVLSPLLWCLVINDRLEDLRKEGFLVYGYPDDITISVRENLLDTLRDLMIDALKLVQSWCETKGLKVNPLNSNVIVFTRKNKPELVEPLKLGKREIAFTNSVKYVFRSLSRP